MSRRRAAMWLLSVPLMVAGSQVAHALAYAIVYPSAQLRLSALLATGHGYMVGYPGYAPLALGVLGGAELIGVGWVFAGCLRRSMQRPLPAPAFAAMPLLAFALQELLERWLVGGSFPWWIVLQPTFRVGLLLQLPFALIAYLIARLLLRAADRAARALRGRCLTPPRTEAAGMRWIARDAAAPRRPALADGRSNRGPPSARPAVIFAS